MTKWEYKNAYVAIIIPEGKSLFDLQTDRCLWEVLLDEELNRYGAEGWEIVSIPQSLLCCNALDGFVLFRRPKEG